MTCARAVSRKVLCREGIVIMSMKMVRALCANVQNFFKSPRVLFRLVPDFFAREQLFGLRPAHAAVRIGVSESRQGILALLRCVQPKYP